MSLLLVYTENEPERVVARATNPRDIAAHLAPHGVRFEQWACPVQLSAHADQAEILGAYADDIARLKREGNYLSADVVRLVRDPGDASWDEKARAARGKFLAEHCHAEDEVRFFVEGSGLFALRLDGRIYLVRCERGDLLSVPAGTRHWFDMGSEPFFCAIRVFGAPDGWIASFTGDTIAQRFPDYDQVASA